jgi:hypothetical protein
MNDKTTRVFNGWLQLTFSEKQEFDAEVRRYQGALDPEKHRMREAYSGHVLRMQTGPLGNTCPCCGR